MSVLAILIIGAICGLLLEAILGKVATIIILLVVICVALIGMWRSK